MIGLQLYWPIPAFVFVVLAAVWITLNVWGAVFVCSQFFMAIVCRGNKQVNTIAFTFDDGPSPGQTTRILEILESEGVKATFFCIGKKVDAHASLAKQVHEAGHILGNHSYFHGKLFDLQLSRAMEKELTDTDAAIQKITGKRPLFFRPPYGVTNPLLASAVKKTNHTSVGWTIRTFDTTATRSEEIYKRICKQLGRGDILLFHDRCEVTIEVLPKVLELVKQRGLKIVPLDQLINKNAYAD